MAAEPIRIAIYLLFLLGASASAGPLLLTTGGTFANYTPTTAMSAPGEDWTVSIQLDSNPAVSDLYLGTSFGAAFSNVTYTLNGSVVAIPVGEMIFKTANSNLGGFDLCFYTTACVWGMEIIGPQLYSGSESAPTILTGVFQPVHVNGLITGLALSLSSFRPVTITAVTATPEPSTFLLSGVALLLAAALKLRRALPLYK
jgi:hypothetical protein